METDARVTAGMPAVTVRVTRCVPGGSCPPEVWFSPIRDHGLVRQGVIAGGGRRSRRGLTPSAPGCPPRGMPDGRRPGTVVAGTVGPPGVARLAAVLASGG